MLLKIIFLCLWVLHLADINTSGMDNVFYYARMKKISIIKSSSHLDNKELPSVSRTSSLRYGFHKIVTLKRKRILVLMIQRLLIQIRWKVSVPQYVNYGRKDNYTSTLIFQ